MTTGTTVLIKYELPQEGRGEEKKVRTDRLR